MVLLWHMPVCYCCSLLPFFPSLPPQDPILGSYGRARGDTLCIVALACHSELEFLGAPPHSFLFFFFLLF